MVSLTTHVAFNDMLCHYNNEHVKGEQAQMQFRIESTDYKVELEPTAEDVQIASEEPAVKPFSLIKAPEINEVITYIIYLGFQEVRAIAGSAVHINHPRSCH